MLALSNLPELHAQLVLDVRPVVQFALKDHRWIFLTSYRSIGREQSVIHRNAGYQNSTFHRAWTTCSQGS